jgi:hypothetical protein
VEKQKKKQTAMKMPFFAPFFLRHQRFKTKPIFFPCTKKTYPSRSLFLYTTTSRNHPPTSSKPEKFCNLQARSEKTPTMLSRTVLLPLAAAAIAANATHVYCCTPSADLVLVLAVVCFAHLLLLLLPLLPLRLILPHLHHTQELNG